MKVLLIRHGMTKGNREKRFIGITDDSLCEQGIEELKKLKYPPADKVVVSPLERCRKTAEIIYGGYDIVCEDLRECDFGILEGKKHEELKDNPIYINWLKEEENRSAEELVFPKGESKKDFSLRCVKAFEQVTEKFEDNITVAFVVHGGVIMTLLEHFCGGFYKWNLDNGGYVEADIKNGIWNVTQMHTH